MQTTWRAIVKILLRLGVPDMLQSDQGTEFVNYLSKTIADDAGFRLIHGRGYHPQSQGSVERGNSILADKIASLLKRANTADWEAILPMAEAMMNSQTSRVHGTSPHNFVYGRPLFNDNVISTQSELLNLLVKTSDNLPTESRKWKDEEELPEFPITYPPKESQPASDCAMDNHEEEVCETVTQVSDDPDMVSTLGKRREHHLRDGREKHLQKRRKYESQRDAKESKKRLEVGDSVRFRIPSALRTKIDDMFGHGSILDVRDNGYKIGTMQGEIQGVVSFSQVEAVNLSPPELVDQGSITIKQFAQLVSRGHPGIAHLKCRCKKGVCNKCICTRNNRHCSSHCLCNGKTCKNHKR